MKITSDGNLTWSKVYEIQGSIKILNKFASAAIKGGDFWLVGVSVSNIPGLFEGGGMVMKFDNAGNLLFCKRYRQTNNDAVGFYAIDFNTSGEIVVGGSVFTSDSLPNKNMTMKCTSEGEVVWARQHDSPLDYANGQVQPNSSSAKWWFFYKRNKQHREWKPLDIVDRRWPSSFCGRSYISWLLI